VVVALQSGDIDFAQVRGKDVPKFVGKPDFEVVTSPADLSRLIVLNRRSHSSRMFGCARRSASPSIGAVIGAAEQGYGIAADSPFNQPVTIYEQGKFEVPAADIEKAKALMQEAGWVDTDNDGIVEKDGQPFKIVLEYNPGWTFMAPVAPLIQAQWKKIGVDAAVRTYDSASFIPAVFRSTGSTSPMTPFINGWVSSAQIRSLRLYFASPSQAPTS
jgi:peptide/nickel transport system substrate-binding protein